MYIRACFDHQARFTCEGCQSPVMASRLRFLSCLVFGLLLLTQGGFLVAYSVDYDVAVWAPIVQGVLFAITALAWLALIFTKKAELSCLFYVWVSYVITLVVNIGILFGAIGDKHLLCCCCCYTMPMTWIALMSAKI